MVQNQIKANLHPAEGSITLAPGVENLRAMARNFESQGNHAQAFEQYKKALALAPENAETHHDIAKLYGRQQLFTHMIDHMQTATYLEPGDPKLWLNLARARISARRHREGYSALQELKRLAPDDPDLWVVMAALFELWLENLEFTPSIVEDIRLCLERPEVNPTQLTSITQALFINQHLVRQVMAKAQGYNLPGFEGLLLAPDMIWATLTHPTFLVMLRRISLRSVEMETCLIILRRAMLCLAARDTITPQAQNALTELLPFVAALSGQCYLNEYIFPETPEETASIEKLSRTSCYEIPALHFALMASYRPAHMLQNADKLAARFSDHPDLKPIIILQIEEPRAQNALAEKIPALTKITDTVSIKVQAQYEDNPYPRWVHTAMPRAHTLPEILRHLFPYLSATDMQGLPPTPQVLIAGCGTGKQPIEQAMLLKPAQFTAIDLSRSSLAYALHKTQGYGLEDQITYAQADILHLPETGKMYDVIYCGGVLHHMRDPLQGWRALQRCLKPGGFMMVALYSARARRFVTKAREWIAQENFPPTIEGIRTCREAIKAMPPDDPRRPQVLWADFYSTSSCRDLLFHVQEHLSNPADLKTTLNTLGLEFLGFQHQDMGLLARYRAANPQDPWGRDLALWDSFEAQNPDIFRAMMHIWVRKKV